LEAGNEYEYDDKVGQGKVMEPGNRGNNQEA